MKKIIIFLFLFVLLFSLFCYAQVPYDKPKEYYSAEEIVQAINDTVNNKYNEDSCSYFLENNAQLFVSKDDTLFNNLNNNPELFTVLENNPELFNIIDQNPQLFLNILLDEQKLQKFSHDPFEGWIEKEWRHGEGRVPVNTLFNSDSQDEQKLQKFSHDPFEGWIEKEWRHGEGRVPVNTLFNSDSQDEQKLQKFSHDPFEGWIEKEWRHGEGRVPVNTSFNSDSQIEGNYTVQLWKEWGIMK